ncbi:AGL268Cp [Eremothecium gossypii ATCC 10895]|uniref:AGL268Cp n=1 Tax=Eremothecium gossypii (strain ATCC 10895 / CBS 109.51 / FGSC 9923 / NRRL Y-1056) TaxID=284811 RepID=Q751H4_EREGS|nr:AGL268Cp [Eremothecium gossypii ATCC 10895]AAS54223.1 AGL268Cp [Eremothecium gossypii ATCC 10895]AEY98549.1 FAGL268Cp [Eremothecium gossypii FDAG1]
MSSYKKPQRYKAGPGDPVLPPQLSEFQGKTTDEVLGELNRMPFFMTKLEPGDAASGENVELEALKALAYDGEPHEVAENFKNQGNDLYKVKRFRDARVMYNKGIEVKCDDAGISELLLLNRAACELELKNYRRCINDCREALKLNPKNPKAFFRIGKAFLQLDKLEEAAEAVDFGLRVDTENEALLSLLSAISKKQKARHEHEQKLESRRKEMERLASILEAAMAIRNIHMIASKQRPDLLEAAKIKLDNPEDIESQLIFPAMIMYPTTGEFDFIASVSELSTPSELLELVLQRPREWFEQPGHEAFSTTSLVAYMETESGGLIKVGKKAKFHDVLKMETPVVPLFDDALRVYFVPKVESEAWLKKWDKVKALENRKTC